MPTTTTTDSAVDPAAFESKSFDAVPGEPAASLCVDQGSQSLEAVYARVDAGTDHRIQNLRTDEQRHHFASELTIATQGELLVKFCPRDRMIGDDGEEVEESLGRMFSIQETELTEGAVLLSPDRVIDPMTHDGFVASAIIAELEHIAKQHQELAERMKRELIPYTPWSSRRSR